MKPLLPTLKEKKRYIVFSSNVKFEKKDILVAIENFIGTLGITNAAPQVILINGKNGILKVNHTYTDEIRAAMLMITKIKDKKAIFKSIKTSGTLKKAKGYMGDIK